MEDLTKPAESSAKPMSMVKQRKIYGFVAIAGALLGWWATLRLYLDYVASLKDSEFIASCNFSDVVSCSANYESHYGSIFGFSNVVIGFTAFALLLLVGVLYASGVSLPGWFHLSNSIALAAAVIFVSYLQWASFTQLAVLCVYCLLIWIAVISSFWLSLGSLPAKGKTKQISVFFRRFGLIFALGHLLLVVIFGQLTISMLNELIGVLFS